MASALSRSVFRKINVFCLATFLLIVTAAVVFAQPLRMSATEAHSAALNGNLIILDIRSPEEWAETGVAKDAWPVTMHDPNFGANLQSIIERYPKSPWPLSVPLVGEAIMSPPSLSKTVFWALSISLKVCLGMAKHQVGSLVIFQLSMSPWHATDTQRQC